MNSIDLFYAVRISYEPISPQRRGAAAALYILLGQLTSCLRSADIQLELESDQTV